MQLHLFFAPSAMKLLGPSARIWTICPLFFPHQSNLTPGSPGCIVFRHCDLEWVRTPGENNWSRERKVKVIITHINTTKDNLVSSGPMTSSANNKLSFLRKILKHRPVQKTHKMYEEKAKKYFCLNEQELQCYYKTDTLLCAAKCDG